MEATLSPTTSLSAPVGTLMRPTGRIAPEDSLERAVLELRRNGGFLPVVENDFLRGIVTETVLALAMADGVSLHTAVGDVMREAETIAPYSTGAEALRRLAEGDGTPLAVVDDLNRLLGLVSGSDLYPHRRPQPRPSTIGGMATPFGVYLTNGVIGAGAKWWGLAATGVTLGLLVTAANIASYPAMLGLSKTNLSDSVVQGIGIALTMVLFLVGMRLIPMAGTHGAEHQVVHAIERGEDLTLDVVRRMPRVHPRCGTNLAAAAFLFAGINSIPGIDANLKYLVAMLVTLGTWRTVGAFLQKYFTTRRPTDKQLENAIRAGNELLDSFAKSRVSAASFPHRLWKSGIGYVLLGSLAIDGLIYALASALNLPF